MEQSQIEGLLRQKARKRVPVLEAALAKTEKKLLNKEQYIARAQERAEKKIARMERMVVNYREDLATIAAGSYRGYNGKPFGATPTISEGIL